MDNKETENIKEVTPDEFFDTIKKEQVEVTEDYLNNY